MKTVQLWAGTIPFLSKFACHYWFVVIDNNKHTRWEVWQLASQNESSWGHLHQNLMKWDTWLPGQHHWLEHQWHGKLAIKIAKVLAQAPQQYGNSYRYRYWPGPNSNSFVQSMLNEAKTNYFLPPIAIGKDHQQWLFVGKIGLLWQFYSPILTVSVMPKQSVEVVILGLGIRLRLKPFKLDLPFLLR